MSEQADNSSADGTSSGTLVGRCEMFDAIATGSMATIHIGRMLGAGGFTRTVAIKRLHPQFALDKEFAAKLRDEAHLLARIRHPNVVPMLDLVEEDGNVYLIMEYVEGVNLARLLEAVRAVGERIPAPIALRIGVGVLHGLHAAHDATNERGEPLKVVHRDVSPPNILVGTDGFTRLLDFGTARALGRLSASRTGQTKRRSSYLSPEQVKAQPVDRRADVFATATVLWECLTGRPLFDAKDPMVLISQISEEPIVAPSKVVADVPRKWDGIVMRGLERSVERRWKTAMAMADAIEAIGGLAQQREVGSWVARLGADRLGELRAKVKALEAKPVRKRAKSRVEPRSRLHIDPAAVERAIAEAAAGRATTAEESRSEAAGAATREVSPPEPAPKPRADVGPAELGGSASASTESTARPRGRAAGEGEPADAQRAASSPNVSGAGIDEGSGARARASRRSLTAVASPVAEPRRGRRGFVWLGLAAVGLLVVGGLVWGLRSGAETPDGGGQTSPNEDRDTAPVTSSTETTSPPPVSAPSTAASTTASASQTATASGSAAAAPATKATSTGGWTAPTATRTGSLYSRD